MTMQSFGIRDLEDHSRLAVPSATRARSVALAPLAPVREDAIYRGLVVEVARIHLNGLVRTRTHKG